MDQLPLPSLQLYSVFSGLGLFYAVVYALTATNGFLLTLWEDVWCAAAVLNFGCCLFFQFVSFIHETVFGKLQNTEKKNMQDKFWNFIFYKFIFVFGVMNVQDMREMLLWSGWFALVGCLLLTSQLCKDRFQYLSFSPTTATSSHAKIIILLSVLLLFCAGLFMVCAIVGWQFGFNYFAFLYSEVYILFAKTLHTLVKYIIHLWDMHHDGLWENRNTYTYYTELILEMSSLCVDFIHHLHMLLWANMFLSVASLILLMKLRYLYQEIQRRMKRHHNYIIVNQTLEKCFHHVDEDQLREGEGVCAICWEKMTGARRLPCGHSFHFGCLRSWLEQDPVCPTCRFSLSKSFQVGSSNRRRQNTRNGRSRNWLLYFNGASIASWLPTFSLELHNTPDEGDAVFTGNSPEFHRGAQQIHNMFPQVPLSTISLDLTNTKSISQTVDNILSGAILVSTETNTQSILPSTQTLENLNHLSIDSHVRHDTHEEHFESDIPSLTGENEESEVLANVRNNKREDDGLRHRVKSEGGGMTVTQSGEVVGETSHNDHSISTQSGVSYTSNKSSVTQSSEETTLTPENNVSPVAEKTNPGGDLDLLPTFEERKQILLNKARTRYLQKLKTK